MKLRPRVFDPAAVLRALVAACCAATVTRTCPAATEGAARRETLSCALLLPAAKPRSGAPITADVRFDWRGRKLLEGSLEARFHDGRELLSTYRSAPLALAPGEQCFRMLLPAASTGVYSDRIQARVRFVTKDRAYSLGSHTVFMPTGRERSLAICISQPRQVPGPGHLEMVDSLRLEHYDPGPPRPKDQRSRSTRRKASGAERALSTFPVHMPPGELPAHPLGYCSYDVALLAGDGFGLLRRRQLDAIARWVEAGGGVFVVPGGGLKEYHVEFLNRLTGGTAPRRADSVMDPTAPERSFLLGSDGGVRRISGEPQKGITRHHAGLGRAVVVTGPRRPVNVVDPTTGPVDVERDLDTPEWRRAAAFLWKVRAGQLDHFVEKGEWRTDQDRRDDRGARHYLQRYGQTQEGQLDFSVQPVQVGSELFKALVPRAVRVIPLWLIVLILVLFGLAVGPGDYFLLGLLRRRRLTWVTFPAICVSFALFTMLLSEWYMGRKDYRNSITFVDVGAGGRVLRTSRYEMIFTARHVDVATETAGGIFAALDHRRFGGAEGYDGRYGYGYRGPGTADRDIPPPVYAGRIPARFRTYQQVRQWTPQLNRVFTLEPTGREGLDLDWAEPFLFSERDRHAKQRMLEELRADGVRDGTWFVFGGRGYRHSRHAFGGGASGLGVDVVRHTSVRPQHGLFSVVSQISPTGGADFEDLSMLDPTDENQRLLVVVTKKGDNFVVYRRLFHGPGGGEGKE